MITAEDLESADQRVREIGRALGTESTMRELHAAVCDEAQVDFDACDNYVRALVIMLNRHMNMSNDRKDQVAIVIRHALATGAIADREAAARA